MQRMFQIAHYRHSIIESHGFTLVDDTACVEYQIMYFRFIDNKEVTVQSTRTLTRVF